MCCVTCCAIFFEPQLLDIMIVQFRNEKVSNHGSIPITIDCNIVAFIVFEEGFHQPIKRTKQSLRLRGLSPEFGLLKENSRKRTKMPTEQEAKPAVVTYSNGGAHRRSAWGRPSQMA
ncbi:hypothetical protein TNCV_120111 [Trichonephila clavipes]|nr:hypothetical protein TNCV_120111 [Trichonephila clavipes]